MPRECFKVLHLQCSLHHSLVPAAALLPQQACMGTSTEGSALLRQGGTATPTCTDSDAGSVPAYQWLRLSKGRY